MHDSQLVAAAGDGDGRGPVKMMRPVVCVCVVKDELVIIARALGGKSVVFRITPKFSGGQR